MTENEIDQERYFSINEPVLRVIPHCLSSRLCVFARESIPLRFMVRARLIVKHSLTKTLAKSMCVKPEIAVHSMCVKTGVAHMHARTPIRSK